MMVWFGLVGLVGLVLVSGFLLRPLASLPIYVVALASPLERA